ncbi:GspH/FimT family pseudopilin [Alteromonas oceanisediminis]|uniref:GspH/FimT family pseudopilin n=1 Tax=Alteromonas oceanisediminis TaxID=2836180 RepID=UPI002023A546|nr:GspH/FimT family pseudopilin [Alteromonas oceanisediminis]
MRNQTGVTLLEMLITLAIVAIVLTTVAPNVQSILIQNRITAEINELSGVIQYARHHAIDQQIDTLVCPSDDFSSCTTNWGQAKMVFADENGDGSRGNDEPILAATGVTHPVNVLTGPNGSMRFLASGAVAAPAVLRLCHENDEAEYARALTISLQGRVKMSRDDDNDGIHEDDTGAALDCN